MWIGFAAGWVIASVTLYAYLVATAKEPQHPECMDCRQSECEECPHFLHSRQSESVRRAA